MALTQLYPASVRMDVADLMCAADGFKHVYMKHIDSESEEDRFDAIHAHSCAALLYALAKAPKTEDELIEEYEKQSRLIAIEYYE